MIQHDTCVLGKTEHPCTRPSLLHLFLVFLKIGAVGFGGGPALISIIRQEVVEKKKWLPDDVYLQGLAISLLPPGSMMVNIAFFVGGVLKGLAGSLLAILGILLPSFILMIGLAAIFVSLPALRLEANIMRGLVPAVTGVLIAMVLRMSRENLKTWWSYLLMLAGALVMFILEVPPWEIILVAFFLGITGWFFMKKKISSLPGKLRGEETES